MIIVFVKINSKEITRRDRRAALQCTGGLWTSWQHFLRSFDIFNTVTPLELVVSTDHGCGLVFFFFFLVTNLIHERGIKRIVVQFLCNSHTLGLGVMLSK